METLRKCRMCEQTKIETDFVLRGKKLTATCKECSIARRSKDYCPCGVREHDCTHCNDPIIRRATSMIHGSRISDKRHNRVCDLDFTSVLNKVVDTPNCIYCDIELQYLSPYLPNHATIDRINNNIGHTINNCVISCRRCNCANYKFLSPKYNEIIMNALII
jgi:hypothetical protein